MQAVWVMAKIKRFVASVFPLDTGKPYAPLLSNGVQQDRWPTGIWQGQIGIVVNEILTNGHSKKLSITVTIETLHKGTSRCPKEM